MCDAGEKRVLKFCVNIIHGTTHTASPECPELSGEEKEGVRSAIREENNFGWKNVNGNMIMADSFLLMNFGLLW